MTAPAARRVSTRVLSLCAAVVCAATLAVVAVAGTSGAAGAHHPDAWLKLCGPTNTCVIQPWHPWVGNDVYGGTGTGETVGAGVEEANMIRFWVAIQNDGSASETLKVKGCSGSSAFRLKQVNVGAYRAFDPAHDITNAFENGSAKFSFPPSSTPKVVVITLTFLVQTSTRGATYSCPIAIHSAAAPTAKDVVVAKMVTI